MEPEEHKIEPLEESLALNRITLDLLAQKKKEHLRLWTIILALILVNLIEVGVFIWYESQMETVETTTTTTTTIDQDTGEGSGNNVYQADKHWAGQVICPAFVVRMVDMKVEQKSTKNLTCTEVFQEIGKRQVLALMFHDHMCDLYSFLNLSGFSCWHKHQYKSESEEFLNTKQYFMSAHNKLLDIGDPGQPEYIIPMSWYDYNRLDLTPQIVRQYTEVSFDEYKNWEEKTKSLYEKYSKVLMEMGNIADAQWINCLVDDVTCELKMIYKVMLKLKATNYDTIYMLDMQHWIHKKYK